jgi:hypothetical protein
MLGGLFYASLFTPMFYTTWMVSRMLWGLICAPVQEMAQSRRARAAPR